MEGHDREELAGEELALAIDFYRRLCYRRTAEEQKTFTDPSDIGEKLHGFKEVLRWRVSSELDREARAYLAETIEFLAIRAEQAAEPSTARLARYLVMAKGTAARQGVA